MSTQQPVTLTCSDCPEGRYVPSLRYLLAGTILTTPEWECTDCRHAITARDVTLEAGETLTVDAAGHLAYTPEA